jgi:hypothetical protein
MRKIHILFLIPFLLLATAVQAAVEPRAEVIDNFESYTETADLRSAWTIYDGFPEISLSDVAHAGAASMRMDYDVAFDPFVNWITFELSDGVDWSDMKTISVYYQGLETNSADSLALQVLDATNEVIFQDMIAGAAVQTGWNRWEMKSGSGLAGADALVIGIQASTSEIPGTGTIYLDDISVTNGVQTVWLGFTDDWKDSENWDNGVQTEFSDAHIPKVPQGGSMPVVTGGSIVAHDLIIDHGATLDLASGSLDLSGTLINNGAIIRSETIGSNAQIPFLLEGGHPGLLISTGSPAATNGVASADVMGLTSVTVSNRSCTGVGGTVNRCYEVSPANPSPSTITFYFNQDDLGDHVCEDLSLYNYEGGAWAAVAGPGDAAISHQCELANFSVTVSGINDYSPFLLSDAEPVAINLQDLSAASPTSFSPVIIAAGLLALTLFILRRRT